MKMPKSPSFRGLVPASPLTSETKRRNRAKNSKPELILRRALFRRGARYRLHARDLPGQPDLIFGRAKLAVFVDGDFWHGRNWRQRRKRLASGSNASYWIAKIESNRLRDSRHSAALRALGWEVVRIWESTLTRDSDAVVEKILDLLESRLRK